MLEKAKINVEEVKLKLEEECKSCKGQLLASQLRKAIERNEKEILCTFCGKTIEPPWLKITIGKKVNRNRHKELNYHNVQTKFISAECLFNDVKERLDSVDFHEELLELRTKDCWKVKAIFWNLIYYFNEYHLPYEFILPYEDKTFENEVKKYKSKTKKNLKVYKPDANASKGGSKKTKP